MATITSPYHVPEGYKGIWLNDHTFVVVKKEQDEKAVRAKFKNRPSIGWQLGYVEYYVHKPGGRHRRVDY